MVNFGAKEDSEFQKAKDATKPRNAELVERKAGFQQRKHLRDATMVARLPVQQLFWYGFQLDHAYRWRAQYSKVW
jgi:hypothetical protein